MMTEFLTRIRYLAFRKKRSEMDEELQFHLEESVRAKIEAGVPASEARRQSLIEFGGLEATRERCEEQRPGWWVAVVLQDIRYALRQLRKAPGFAFGVIATIAFALGANLTVFAFFQAVLLKTLPVRNPGELYRVSIDYPGHPHIQYFSFPDLRHMAKSSSPVSLMGFTNVVQYHIGDPNGTTGKVNGQLVTGNFFSTLGASPLLGRPILGRDNTEGAPPVAVISYDLWAARFGRTPEIIGRRVRIQRSEVTIVGVMPKAFQGVVPGQRTDVWMPLSIQSIIGFGGYASMDDVDISKPWLHQQVSWLHLIARSPADPGGNRLAAHLGTYIQAQVHASVEHTKNARERENLMHVRVLVQSAAHGMPGLRDRFSAPLRILFWLVGFLLLSGCLNIINLVLARFRAREHEMSVRLSLGSSRSRLIAQLAAENLILCLTGALASVALARVGSSVIQHWLVTDQSIQLQAQLDSRSLLFGALLAVAACFLISLAPALRVRDLAAARALHVRATTVDLHRARLSSVLMIAQLAVATATLIITSLLLHTLWNYEGLNLGVNRSHTLSVSIDPSAAGYVTAGQEAALYPQLQQALDRIPGVISSSYAGCALMNHGCAYLSATVPGVEQKPHVVERNYVGPNYFATVGMDLISGRGILQRDEASSQKVAVVNRAFERQFLRGGNVLGQTVELDGRKALIVGVIANARTDSIKSHPVPFVYLPIAQAGTWNISDLEIRTAGHPASIATAVRHAILSINRAIPVGPILTVGEEANRGLAPEILLARLGIAFTFLSVLIGALGVYSLIDYETGQRRNEFAIRMAVGATRAAILRRVFERSVLLCAAGCALGVLISLGLSRLIASLLFGVSQYSPQVYFSAAMILLIVSALAVFLPSWRAASVDPVSTLHRE